MAKRAKKESAIKVKAKQDKVKRLPRQLNPCFAAPMELRTYPDEHFGIRLPFNPSNARLQRYAEHFEHAVPRNWKATPPTPTFDTNALRELIVKYPSDPLYPLVEGYREVEKCLGTYVEGMRPQSDKRVRGEFNHKPKTLRLAQRSPSLQVLPRTDDKESVYTLVKGMFEAAPGHVYFCRDFAGIEAVLVGYLANDKNLVRLSGGTIQDVHGFVATTALGKPPDLNAPDAEVAAYLKSFKDHPEAIFEVNGEAISYETLRTGCKRAVYLSFYGGTPHRMVQSEPDIFPTKKVAEWYQDLFFSTFPSVRQWQWATCEEAEQKGYVSTPDGFRQHFHDVFHYDYSERDKRWVKKFGDTAKECISSKPQHLAMVIGALALVEFWNKHRELAEGLRLMIHDEIFGEWPLESIPEVDRVLKEVMERPCKLLPLPPEWQMGEFLSIATDSKIGTSWGSMSKYKGYV